MSEDSTDIRAQLSAHARRDDLARLVRTVALSAADERRARFSDGLDELLREAELEPEDGVVGSVNVLRVLSSGDAPKSGGRDVLGLLLARGLRIDLDGREQAPDDESWERIAASLAWLSANTHVCGTLGLDEELEDAQAERIWTEMKNLVSAADASRVGKGRAEAMVAAAALRASNSAAARAACDDLRGALDDPLLGALFAAAPVEPAAAQDVDDEDETKPMLSEPPPAPAPPAKKAELSGEIVPAPMGPIALVLWTVTGLILLRYLFRFVANVLLRCKRPVEVQMGSAGVTLKSKLDVLGKTVRTQETHIPLTNLARAVREVRYPRLALYAGILALAVGTYFGVALVTDGARSGSPSLLALGAGVVALGVIVDLVFSILLPGKTGKHRVIFVPRRGRSYAVRIKDELAADEALATLASSV